jgi:hypothetical protein
MQIAKVDKGRLNGLVKDSEGKPISGALVTANLGAPEPATTVTDEDGSFDFGYVKPQICFLLVSAQGFAAGTQDVAVEAGRSAKANYTLTRGEHEISGRVLDEDKKPLKAEVTLLRKGLVIGKIMSAESTGSYDFKYLQESFYEVRASSLCHSPRAWSSLVGSKNYDRKEINVDFELPVIENCVALGNCDVCDQIKRVKYCKFCHAFICDDCRHNYPERVKAMLRRRFSLQGRKMPNEEELDSIEKELSSTAVRRERNGDCGGCSSF